MNTVKLQLWMLHNNISQAALGRILGVVPTTINHWVNNKTEIPLWAAMRIAKIAKMPIENLFELEGKND